MVPLDARINDVYGDKKKKKGREETIFLRTYDQKGKKKQRNEREKRKEKITIKRGTEKGKKNEFI